MVLLVMSAQHLLLQLHFRTMLLPDASVAAQVALPCRNHGKDTSQSINTVTVLAPAWLSDSNTSGMPHLPLLHMPQGDPTISEGKQFPSGHELNLQHTRSECSHVCCMATALVAAHKSCRWLCEPRTGTEVLLPCKPARLKPGTCLEDTCASPS